MKHLILSRRQAVPLPGLIGAAFLPFIMYNAEKCTFSDGAEHQ